MGCPRALSISPGSSQASGERLHPEPLPGPLGPACPMYQYQYSPPVPHPVYHGFDEWQQIRYPPAMPGEHAPGQNFHHFPPVSTYPRRHNGEHKAPWASGFGVFWAAWSAASCSMCLVTHRFCFHLLLQPEYPWRPPCAMSRSQNAPAVPGVKPVPKDLGKAPSAAPEPQTAGSTAAEEGWDGFPGSAFPSAPTDLRRWAAKLLRAAPSLAAGSVPAPSPCSSPSLKPPSHKGLVAVLEMSAGAAP